MNGHEAIANNIIKIVSCRLKRERECVYSIKMTTTSAIPQCTKTETRDLGLDKITNH